MDTQLQSRPTPTPTITPRRSRRSSTPTPIRARLGLDIKTITFALSLCLPYVGATPVPALTSKNNLLTSVDTMNTTNITTDIIPTLHTAAQHLAQFLTPRGEHGVHPLIAVAELDHNGKWVIPTGYVILVQKFKAGIIVLSYIIAFVGSLCTLELLVRRTNNAGWRNRLLLTAAGICFGGVSTFAMHFVFNNALSLHHPMQDMQMYPSLYLQYDPGFTVLSLVASITAMTLAFFIMGTDMHDWFTLPGKRRRRDEKRKRNGGDEYGRWKKTHRGRMKGSESGMGFGIGALMETAGKVAKWSLVDTGENRWSSIGKKGDKGLDEGNDWEMNGDGVTMKRDKSLDEMEFRLGKQAVRAELDKRRAPTPSTINGSIHEQQQGAVMPEMPPSIFNPNYRRGSLPTDQPMSAQSEMFTPGYNDSVRNVHANDSTTGLLQDNPWASVDSGFEPYKRRASLPTVTFGGRPEQSLRPPTSLARIQSLPEHEVEIESYPISRKPSEAGHQSPHMSIKSQIDAHHEDSNPQGPRKTLTRRAFGKVEVFLGFDVVTTTDIIKIFITGTIAGFGVAGMHYIGQASITGMPYIAYRPEYVIGSVIIASGAVCIALYIMFIMLRPKLKHTLWSKLAVAVILAAAVCLMHFTGMRGTVYGWPPDQAISRQSQLTGTNAAIVGVVTALAFAACVGCAVFFAVSSWAKSKERRRRRRVVIAAVFLDQYDRVLVNSTDGMLPMCDIASLTGDQYSNSKRSSTSSSTNSSALGMDLTPGHDAFVSALKMSWSWRSGLVPSPSALTQEAVNGQLTMNTAIAEMRRGSQYTDGSSVQDNRPVRLSIAKFLEMFGNAAANLAVRVTGQEQGIMRLGVLYDQILTTCALFSFNRRDG
jgi:NO-binding membrane sensor protein with MHYT domain